MTKDIDIRTNETFTTTNGKTVRYQEIFTGITDEIHRYGFKGGKSMSGEDLKELRQTANLNPVRPCPISRKIWTGWKRASAGFWN